MAENKYGDSQVTYNQYLKVPELISLQHCLSSPESHDELQFIIVHQTYELWFKLVLFELDSIMTSMDRQEMRYATYLFRRVNEIWRILYQQIHVLETMTPLDFLEFRDNLKPASGFQSIQFHEIEFLSNLKNEAMLSHIRGDEESVLRLRKRLGQETLWDAFLRLMTRQGFEIPADRDPEKIKTELVRLHRESRDHYDLFLLSESMIEYDELIGLWRLHHIRMVERMIGNKMGTGGSEGVRYLATTLQQKCFPELWDMRSILSR